MFDIGVNLTSSQFAKDRDDVVARAFDAGVNGLLITGTNLRESQQAQKLARQYSSCWSTAGVHPHDSSQWQAVTEEAIIELAAQPEVVAIGECGLDFNRNFSTPEEQELAFVAQLRIAAELNMPVFMHCRDAHERFMTLASVVAASHAASSPRQCAIRCKIWGRWAGSLRRDDGFGVRSRGSRYGASVSISNFSAGINGNNSRSSSPRRSSQTQPVMPI